ncbi:MAG: TPM domain-containing protein [Hyphomicrobium sp.]|jgi:putative membrane protein
MPLISDQGAKRIGDAISAAERQTSGEIVAVITAESSSYLYAPFLWAAIVSLLVPWPLIEFTWWPATWIYLTQLAVFLALLVAFLPKRVRRWLVPHSIKRAQARRRAREQFLVQNLHTTAGRTGVLIFVSLAERHAEILADAAINARVPDGTWQEIVDTLTREIGAGRPVEGFVAAVTAVGRHLATHFPPGSADADELPNHLIMLAEQD